MKTMSEKALKPFSSEWLQRADDPATRPQRSPQPARASRGVIAPALVKRLNHAVRTEHAKK